MRQRAGLWLRSALFNLYFFSLTATGSLIGVAIASLAPHRLLDLGRLWVRLVRAGLRGLCGIEIVVTGCEHLPQGAAMGAALIAPMHQSAFDTLIWLGLLPRASYVLKRELLRIPLFGRLILPAGQIAVDREGGASAMRGLMRDARAAAAAGRQIVIFPQGTRVAPGHAVKLQPGVAAVALATGLRVIPVATDSGLRWGRRAFAKRPGIIHIAIGPPIPPGLGRDALLEQIGAAWDRLAAGWAGPVDKSVGTALSSFPPNQKDDFQHIEKNGF